MRCVPDLTAWRNLHYTNSDLQLHLGSKKDRDGKANGREVERGGREGDARGEVVQL